MANHPPRRLRLALTAALQGACAVALQAACAGCAPKAGGYRSLVGAGVLPLSTSNPYVGANLFVADEAAAGVHLRHFLDARGAPHAVERESADRMTFYYAAPRAERYILEKEGDPGEWVARGPFSLDRESARSVAKLGAGKATSEPVFRDGRGEEFRFGARRPAAGPRLVVSPSIRVVERPKPPPPKKKAVVVVKRAAPAAPPLPPPPQNADQQAIAMAEGWAERTAVGDVIHTAAEGETLASVAGWYAGSPEAAGRLAAANGLVEAAPLGKGVRVTVPAALVKNARLKK